MPSILPSYEYDIFISYRHNDNRSGRITEIVEQLKIELASTLKEPVSIYFDKNPHDGLLETHHVDKSLEGKLKCLVFVPIISQTYCDINSFAWKHEFCAFNKISQEDKFGRDIKLSNGNVTSRILPIKIHDLDSTDEKIIEKELGGMLRPIEFIYKEPGVNRPLELSDSRHDNQNKTDYKNQINKVANAVKEIIYSIVKPNELLSTSGSFINSAKPIETRESLAVLPFKNMSSNVEQEYFSDGITENIISELAANRSLKIISRTSIMRYKNSTLTAPEIAKELDVYYILEGGVQIHGNKVRINVQLVDAVKDDLTWSKVFVENMDDIFEIQSKVANVVASELQASISEEEEKEDETPTRNLAAYNLFLKGRHAFNQWGVDGYIVAADYFNQAIKIDPEFKQAYSLLASSYSARMSWNGDLSPKEALINIDKWLEEAWKRGPSDNDYLTKAFVEFFIHKNFEAAENYLKTGIEMAPNNATLMYVYSYVLNMAGRFEEAHIWVRKAKSLDPLTVGYFNFETIGLYLQGELNSALEIVKEGNRLYPGVLRFYDFMARIYLTKGDWNMAVEAVSIGLQNSSIRSPSMIAWLAIAYNELNKKAESNTLLEELLNRSKANEKGVNFSIVYIYASYKDFNNARYWFGKAQETNDVDLIWKDVDPLLLDFREYNEKEGIKTLPNFSGVEKFLANLLEYEMPKLPYHNTEHIYDVLKAVLHIAEKEEASVEDIKILRVATLLHDIGFIRSTNNHEERGVEMAHEILPDFGFDHEQVTMIGNLILATRLPQSPSTKLEQILCDADLDYLGRDDFYEIGNRLFQELKEAGVVETEREWNLVQRTFLQSHKYHTNFNKVNREPKKQEYLRKISEKLNNGK